MDIPKRLNDLMQQNDVSQTEMASHLGCSRPFLNQILRGKRRMTFEMLEKACAFFGITLGDFFQEEGELPLHIENFIAYCKDLSEQEIVALRAVVELFPSKNKTKR